MKEQIKKDGEQLTIFLGLPGQEKKEYELKVTHKVLKRFSSLRKCAIDKLDQELMTYDGISCMMYCMLTRADFSLTGEIIDEMLEEVPLDQIMKVCTDAVFAAFPSEEGDQDGEQSADADPQTAAATGEKA